MNRHLPQRIVCLTTETVEVLYALGEQDRIAGISGYTVFPKEARKGEAEGLRLHQRRSQQDPRCAAGPRAHLLQPAGRDQPRADRCRRAEVRLQPAQRGRYPGDDRHRRRLVGAEEKALAMVAELQAIIDRVRAEGATLPKRRASISRNGTSRRSAASAGSRR